MFALAYVVWACIILYVIISRGLPRFISWILCKSLNADVKIGRISFFPFSLKDIRLCKNDCTVAVDSVGMSSNFVNSSYSKILAIYVSDVRIEKELCDISPKCADESRLRHLEESSSDHSVQLNPSNINIPPQIITLSQITSIHVYNVNIMMLRIAHECLLHTTIDEVKLEGNTDQMCVQITLNISNFKCKVLHHVGKTATQPCLAEISLSSNVIINVDPQKKLKLKVFSLSVHPELDIVLSEGLLKCLPLTNPADPVTTTNVPEKRIRDRTAYKVWSFLPETLNVNMENTKVKLLCESPHRSLAIQLKKMLSTSSFSSVLPQEHVSNQLLIPGELQATFMLEDFQVGIGICRTMALTRVEVKLLISEHSTESTVTVSSLSCLYFHEDVKWWLETISNWSSSQRSYLLITDANSSLADKSNVASHKNTWKIIFDKPHTFTLEVWDLTVVTHFNPHSAMSSGLNHSRLTLEGKKCLPEVSGLDRCLNGLLESWWCHIGDQPLPDNLNKKHHYWNTPMFVGVLLFEAKEVVQCGRKIESMIDCTHLEWNPTLENLVIDGCRCVKELQQITSKDKTTLLIPPHPLLKQKSPGPLPTIHVHVAITNTNIFAMCEKKVSLLLRVDSGNYEMHLERVCISMEGIKLGTVFPSSTHFPCVKSSELKTHILHIAMTTVTYQRLCREVTVQLTDPVSLHWTTADHLTIYHVVEDVISLKRRVYNFRKPISMAVPAVAPRRSKQVIIRMKAEGPLDLTAWLTSSNRMSWHLREFSLHHHIGQTGIHIEEMVIQFDLHDIFMFTGIEVAGIPGCAELKAVRQSFDILEMKANRAWTVTMASAKACFPHSYNFADVFTEKAISIIKWLKSLHRSHSSHVNELVISSDLWIKFKEMTIEVCDDPFEVHLRDNYELLEDEFNENQKRWKMLDAKVEELRKTHLHLPANKVNELYRSLAQRNADIYIKRSRQMYASSPVRTQLYSITGKDIEVLALADITMHGKEKIVSLIRMLDPESPWPEDTLEFSTLWCRMIQFNSVSITVRLRDYPSPLLDTSNFTAWGTLLGAEQEPSKRAKRTVLIKINEPWVDATVERSMPPLKFYYDISCDAEHFTMGYGPCWEPAIAEFNLAMDLVSRPSVDPSPPLPFWDKIRLLFHGRLTMMIQKLTMVLHSSSNPYNTTEEMDFTWTNLEFDWTNAKLVLKGNLDVYVRTASKYDDCRLLHFPNLKLVIKLDWQCLGDPNDHHAVMPCAPDKLPEYSINQKHDSYRAFRSLNFNFAVVMDTKPVPSFVEGNESSIPSMLFYSNTLKWLDNLKVILSAVTRPIRRGIIFHNSKPRKISLSRHYKTARFFLSLHRFEVCYWMSFAKQRGFCMQAEKLTLSSEYNMSLFPIQDGLKHRPRAVFSIIYMNCELSDGEIWLQSAASDDAGNEMSFRAPVEKNYFLSLSRLSYGREASRRCISTQDGPETPTHRLVVHDLRGSWTKTNRTIVFCLFDSYMRNKLMRHNLSTEALKSFKMDPKSSPMKSRSTSSAPVSETVVPIPSSATSPLSRLQSGHALNMLQKLIAEADGNSVVFSEDLSGNTREQILHGVQACQTDDVLHCNWLVELINSQVLLRGCETPGYVIMSAARAQILQRIHQPVWKDRTLVSKTTWVGSLECMQYYATVDSGESTSSGDNIQWLALENIEEKESMVIADMADLVGSGQGVGGVVSNTVGGANIGSNSGVQLQRIVSRCGCQFFYASYGNSLDPNTLEDVPSLGCGTLQTSEDSGLWRKDTAVDSFTLTHHDLNCCTNSVQYLMLLDIINNVLLYVEPGKKEATEKLQRLQFQLQLSSIEDQRRPILLLQNNLRLLMFNLRRLEKETYTVQKLLDEHPYDEVLSQQMDALESQVYDTKMQINAQADELAMTISCFKEMQLSANRNVLTAKDQQVPLRRRNEVCFKHAQWRLTEADGLLGVADIVLSNFLYSKVMKIDDSAEHLLELGYVKVTNCLPNQIYKAVLQPTTLCGNIPIDRQCALRIFCREKAPVGGISIKEHFEVNVVPMTLKLTYQFFKTILKFCFPEKDTDLPDEQRSEDMDAETASISSGGSIRSSKRKIPQRRVVSMGDQDDIEKMKERAEKNKMFLYIKIPEVPIRVSYKGKKEKNIEDVHDFNLVLPTLEYHNVTWTWLDLLLAMKSDSKKALLSQAIKQKLQIKSSRASVDDESSTLPQEEDKARLLLGSLLMGGKEKNRKHLFGKSYKSDTK